MNIGNVIHMSSIVNFSATLDEGLSRRLYVAADVRRPDMGSSGQVSAEVLAAWTVLASGAASGPALPRAPDTTTLQFQQIWPTFQGGTAFVSVAAPRAFVGNCVMA